MKAINMSVTVVLVVLTSIVRAINTVARQEASFVLSEGMAPGKNLRFQHSLDGHVWQDAFEVSVALDDGVVDRSAYAAALRDLLSSTAASSSNRHYFLRSAREGEGEGEGEGAFGAFGSIPLSCWAGAGADAVVEVAVGLGGGVLGVTPMAPCDGMSKGGMAVVDRVKLIRPRVVSVSPGEGMGAVAGDVAERLTGVGAVGATKNDKTSKKPDDRTWLQKNWLFVALGLFILANKLGGATGGV